uniref:tRNA nucleotidyltransferase/poly(A) polymerase n=1 Tax=Pithovirus LCPAC304 TaxID=2506594 RepID=A0A481Z8A3_9VIRU|nr:MAG: tRNA nucleotidyltransferase/poly(A) polymerase [Pithovirus LCPAC304]
MDCTTHIVEKIASSFSHKKELVWELQQYGVLAGGAIVYALCDFVPLETVGDIDVFVATVEIGKQVLSYLCEQYPIFHIETPDSQATSRIDEPDGKTTSPVVSFVVEGALPIQIIVRSFECPMDVLESFDLDYVQCGIAGGTLYQTSRCEMAHTTRKIRYFRDPTFRGGRLEKAIQKGFSAPLFKPKGWGSVTYSPMEYDMLELRDFEISEYITWKRSDEWIDFQTLQLLRINGDMFEFECMDEASKKHTLSTKFATLRLTIENQTACMVDCKEHIFWRYRYYPKEYKRKYHRNDTINFRPFPTGEGLFLVGVYKGCIGKIIKRIVDDRVCPVSVEKFEYQPRPDRIEYTHFSPKKKGLSDVRARMENLQVFLNEPLNWHHVKEDVAKSKRYDEKFYRKNALRAFLYYVKEEKKSVPEAATRAYAQYKWDASGKDPMYNPCPGMGGRYSRKVTTIDELLLLL